MAEHPIRFGARYYPETQLAGQPFEPREVVAEMSNLVLRGGRVWDGLSDGALERDVFAADGLLVAEATGDPQMIDVRGCTVIPGLIEAHAHLCFNAQRNWREVYDAASPGTMLLQMAGAGRTMLEAGITTVRDLGAPTGLAVELCRAFAAGLVPGPRLIVAGAPVTTTGGHCWFMGGEADGELEIRKAVRERVKAGCDWIKVMATGGNMTRGTNTLAAQYTVDELAACVDEAHRLRRKVTAHCHGTAGIRVAVEARVDMLEHCSFSGRGAVDFDPGLVDRIAAAGIAISPTVSIGYRLWPDDGLRAQRAMVMRSFVEAGCRIVMSTDCGIPNVPHAAFGAGLQVFQELTGLTAVESLRHATSASAEILGLDDRGTIEPRKLADVVVLDGDPTVDLGALGRVRLVVKGGEVVFRSPGM